LFSPQGIRFDDSILVAVIGLAVNLFSAFLLQGHHDHGHDHPHYEEYFHADHDHEHEHESAHEHPAHQDHNLRAAYLHVLADALTSVLAIAALISGKAFGWIWMDAVMGLVGAAVITRWSVGLLRDTSQILLDAHPIDKIKTDIKERVERDADNRICDLHVWWVGPEQYAASISLVTHFPQPVEHYKGLLSGSKVLVHVTVEVNVCLSEPCISLAAAINN
jgi:cation diffusion facilitator family transporter